MILSRATVSYVLPTFYFLSSLSLLREQLKWIALRQDRRSAVSVFPGIWADSGLSLGAPRCHLPLTCSPVKDGPQESVNNHSSEYVLTRRRYLRITALMLGISERLRTSLLVRWWRSAGHWFVGKVQAFTGLFDTGSMSPKRNARCGRKEGS